MKRAKNDYKRKALFGGVKVIGKKSYQTSLVSAKNFFSKVVFFLLEKTMDFDNSALASVVGRVLPQSGKKRSAWESTTVNSADSNKPGSKSSEIEDLQNRLCRPHGYACAVQEDHDNLVAIASTGGPAQVFTPQAKSVGAPALTSMMADIGRLSSTPVAGGENAPWSIYFGEGRYPYKSNYDVERQDTWTLPQALYGEIKRLSETVEQLVMLDGNFYNEVISPIVYTTALGIKWSEVQFLPHIADVVPELGVARLVRSKRMENSARFVRRGIGFIMEHGFMNTPEGVRHYLMTVNQLAQAAIETNKFDVMSKILQSHDQNLKWSMKMGSYSGKKPIEFLKDDKRFWAHLQKAKNGFETMDTALNERMVRWRGEADTYIVHPCVRQFLAEIPPEKTDFFLAGPAGPQRVADGPNALTTFRGNPVYITRSFYVGEQEPVDLMQYPVQIGEFHIMSDRTAGCAPHEYDTCMRDIQIFDEEANDWAEITLREAQELCGRLSSDGSLVPIDTEDPIVDAYGAEAVARDPFYYKHLQHGASEPTPRLIDYFANMGSQHLKASSRLRLGHTVREAMRREGIAHWARADELLRTARAAVADMENYSWAEVELFLTAANGWVDRSTLRSSNDRGVSSNKPVFAIDEFEFSLITTNAPVAAPRGLPPGFQTYEGIREVVRVYRARRNNLAGSVLANVAPNTLKALEEFVEMFDQVALKLATLFPGSEAVNERNASTWFTRPTSASVLFDGIVNKFRLPLWASEGFPADDSQVAEAQGFPARSALVDLNNRLYDAWSVVVTAAEPDNVNAVRAVTQTVDVDTVTGAQFAATKTRFFNVFLFEALVSYLPSTDDANVKKAKIQKIKEVVPVTKLDEEMDQNTLRRIVALHKLGETSEEFGPSFFDVSRGSAKDVRNSLLALYKEFKEISEIQPRTTGARGQNGAYARSNLVLAPAWIVEIGRAAANATRRLPYLPSSYIIPDMPAPMHELANLSGMSAVDREQRSVAFIASHVVQRKNVAAQFGPVQIASMIQAFNVDRANGQQNDYSSGDTAMVGADLGTPDDEGHAGLRFRPAASSVATADPEHFIYKRDYLMSDSARRNADELASLDGHSWSYIFAVVFNLTPVRREAFTSFIQNNILYPLNFIVARPHAEYQGCYVVKIKRGADTIATYQRRGEFMVGDDTNIGAHIGQYRYYASCIVFKERNIGLLRNTFINGYERGMGSKPYTHKTYAPHNDEYGDGSFFVFAVGYEETEQVLPQAINISGSHSELVRAFGMANDQGEHYSSAAFYAAKWKWQRGLMTEIDTSKVKFTNDYSGSNQLTFLGSTRYRDVKSKEFTIELAGRGHWGPEGTYTGCANVRAGHMQMFSPPSISRVHVI
jgi:hypothetical protein